MTAKTRADIQTEIDSLLPNNTTFDIDPGDVRTVHETSKDSNLNLLETSAQAVVSDVNHTGALSVKSVAVEPLEKVRVDTIADMPAATMVGGVSTVVLGNKHYIINKSFSMTTPWALPGSGNRSILEFVNRARVTYTGTDSLFKDPAAEGELEMDGFCEIAATAGDIWDIVAGAGGFSIQSFGGLKITEADALGTIDCGLASSGVGFFFGSFLNFNQGLIVIDSFFTELNTIFMQGNNQVGCVYVTVQGASTVGSVNMLTLTALNGTNETLFDLNTNIQSTVDSINIRGCQQEGGLNGLVFKSGSLTERSEKVLAIGNPIVGDTVPGGMLSLTGNATDTVLDPSTPTLVTGTWVVEDESQFTGTTGGRLTYNDIRDITIEIDATVSMEPATGSGQILAAYIAKNGVAITASGKAITVDNNDPQNLGLLWRDSAVTGDYYEIFVENRTSGTDVTATDVILRIP